MRYLNIVFFNIKIIAAEILTFIIWIAVLVQFILSKTAQEKFIGFGLLLFVTIFGIFLIRSVLKGGPCEGGD